MLFRSVVPASPRNGPLIAAIWLASATTAYTAFRALAHVFRQQWQAFRVRRFAVGHVVVCGLGATGLRVATAFAEQGHLVVAIEIAPDPTSIEACRERGIVLLAGDARDRLFLTNGAAHRARYLVACCGEDGTNASVALVVQQLAGRRSRPLRCIVQIADERLCSLLEQSAVADPGTRPVTMEFFNVYRAGPRALLDSVLGATRAGSEIEHVVVIGRGRVAAQVASEVARRWMIDPADSRRITLLAPGATALGTTLHSRFPEIERSCEVVAHDVDAADADAMLEDVAFWTDEHSVVLVCEDDDNIGLRATIRLRHELPSSVEIVLCVTSRSGTEGLLRLTSAESLPNVQTFPLLDRVCQPEVLLNGDRELLAQTIHANYVNKERRRDVRGDDDPALVAWEQLPEELRAANRAQAADISHKLAAVGLRIAASTRWERPGPVFDEKEVDVLARLEHERWSAERLAGGWRFGPARDVDAKLHPSLVGWDELDEDDRDRDREVVLALPLLLARAGYAIVPASTRSSGLNEPTGGSPGA